jgi:hypothetical protein
MTDCVEWGVLLKCHIPPDSPEPSHDSLERMVAALACRADDTRLTGSGRDFTVWFWWPGTNASDAVRSGAAALREAAAAEGLPPLRVVRSHAASTNGRVSPFPGTRKRLGTPGVWSVLYRAQRPQGAPAIGAAELERVRAGLTSTDALVTLHSDKEKLLVSDGSSFTARFWADAPEPAAALRAGRADLLGALASAGLSGWTIVRAQAVTAAARHGDTFPGAYERTLNPDEETR